MVYGMLVGTMNVCWKDKDIALTAVSSLYHCTRGIGLPIALQDSIAKIPTLVM